MEIDEENKIETQAENKPVTGVKRLGGGLVISIVLISLLAGGAAGIFGGLYASQSSLFDHSVVKSSSDAVAEKSSVTDVVKKDSPAVVSIIISKNLNQYQQDFNNPFFFDPF